MVKGKWLKCPSGRGRVIAAGGGGAAAAVSVTITTASRATLASLEHRLGWCYLERTRTHQRERFAPGAVGAVLHEGFEPGQRLERSKRGGWGRSVWTAAGTGGTRTFEPTTASAAATSVDDGGGGGCTVAAATGGGGYSAGGRGAATGWCDQTCNTKRK